VPNIGDAIFILLLHIVVQEAISLPYSVAPYIH
jgi:hypothetical protein